MADNAPQRFSEFLSPDSLRLMSACGKDLVRDIGYDVIRGVVLDVLGGKNLRDSTEVLTRRRIVALNLATTNIFIKGPALQKDFFLRLPEMATGILAAKRITKADRWLAQWTLGLTDKAFQNVLRDDPAALAEYRNRYVNICRQAIESHTKTHGELKGTLELGPDLKAEVNWLMMTYLLNTIGAQTLAIRGSEKSAYGKLFEKLVLGSLLSILGFKHVASPPAQPRGVFWLTSQSEKRESDATLLYEKGKGVRFDIGFIGRGNPEISLDKVTRFEREVSLGRRKYYISTIILVDRVGANSRIEELARRADGTIIQMSASYWPRQVARELKRILGYKHPLTSMEDAEVRRFLERKIKDVRLDLFMSEASDARQPDSAAEEVVDYNVFPT